MKLSLAARGFIALVIILGLSVFGIAIRGAHAFQTVHFAALLLVACLAARLKVKLPGVTGSMSVNLPFILLAVAETSLIESLLVGCCSNLMQYLPRDRKKFNFPQAVFNFGIMALAVESAHLIYASPALAAPVASPSLRLAIATAGFFLVNTVAMAIILSLTEAKGPLGAWLDLFRLSFPYFLASAGVAGVALTLVLRVGWQVPLGILPLMAAVFYCYRRYFSAMVEPGALSRPAQPERQMAASGEIRA